MIDQPFRLLTAPHALELAERAELPPKIRAVVGAEERPVALLDRLTAGSKHVEALRLLAFALPKREAVWWGCLCVWRVQADAFKPTEEVALQAAVRWVLDPSEERRRLAGPAAAAVEGTPAGHLAQAAFQSGGSLVGPELPVVPPAPELTAKNVAVALLLAPTAGPPDQVPLQHERFLSLGIGIAQGKHRWLPG